MFCFLDRVIRSCERDIELWRVVNELKSYEVRDEEIFLGYWWLFKYEEKILIMFLN